MSLDALIMSAGVFVAVLPYLGFPNSIDSVLFLIAGVFIVCLGIALRRRGTPARRSPSSPSATVEHSATEERVAVQ